jgi:flagellar basal body-associated protein FliL
MDPKINQPLQADPTAQPTLAQLAVEQAETPNKKGGKMMMLIIIVLLLVIGMVAYIIFANSQINQNPTSRTENVIKPSPAVSSTMAPEQEIDVSSPEADLQQLDTDVNSL